MTIKAIVVLVFLALLAGGAAAETVWGNNIVWGNNVVGFATPPTVTGLTIDKVVLYPNDQAQVTANVASGGFTLDKYWFVYTLGDNETTAVEGSNNVLLISPYASGTYTVTVFANDTTGLVGSDTTTVDITLQPGLNETQTETFNLLVNGQPLQSMSTLYIALTGSLFWIIVLGAIYVSLWLKTENFAYPTLWLIFALSVFNVYIVENGPDIQYVFYGAIILAVALVMNKLLGSSYTE